MIVNNNARVVINYTANSVVASYDDSVTMNNYIEFIIRATGDCLLLLKNCEASNAGQRSGSTSRDHKLNHQACPRARLEGGSNCNFKVVNFQRLSPFIFPLPSYLFVKKRTSRELNLILGKFKKNFLKNSLLQTPLIFFKKKEY